MFGPRDPNERRIVCWTAGINSTRDWWYADTNEPRFIAGEPVALEHSLLVHHHDGLEATDVWIVADTEVWGYTEEWGAMYAAALAEAKAAARMNRTFGGDS